MCHPAGLAIGAKTITFSTAGWVPGIRKYRADRLPYRLAFSVTSAIPAKRAQVLPVEKTWSLATLVEEIKAYVMISGFNVGREDAEALRDTFVRVVQNIHDKYPNLAICYVSSRIYGGYAAQGGLNPEPQAYESGFAVKWLIEQQIAGDPALNFDPALGPVRAPLLLLWGPYLWANGTLPRSDGLVWTSNDLETDRVHPSPAGEQQVARLLSQFFATDTTAASWWRAQPGTMLRWLDATDDATVALATPGTNLGADSLLSAAAGAAAQNSYLRFDGTALGEPVLYAKLSLRVFGNGGGSARLVSDVTWDESSLTWATAPAIGTTVASVPQASRDGSWGADVTSAWAADADHVLSFALTTPAIGPMTFHSREGNDPPRLVFVVSVPVTDVPPGTPRAAALFAAPNPTRAGTRVAFTLPVRSRASVAVYALDGRRVATLRDGMLEAGEHTLQWDGRDGEGRKVAPGVYLLRLVTPSGASVARVAALR
ncbi:MAG: DNRLRE domain-containing protein, partial [Candidatus Eisenbacteria bacterium]